MNYRITILFLFVFVTSTYCQKHDSVKVVMDSVLLKIVSQNAPTISYSPNHEPNIVYQPTIKYPVNAKYFGKVGEVIVLGSLDTLGNVQAVQILKSSSNLFVEEAFRLAKLYKFTPIISEGVKRQWNICWSIIFKP